MWQTRRRADVSYTCVWIVNITYLCLSKTQWCSDFESFRSRQVFVNSKLSFQFEQLLAGERSSGSTRFGSDQRMMKLRMIRCKITVQHTSAFTVASWSWSSPSPPSCVESSSHAYRRDMARPSSAKTVGTNLVKRRPVRLTFGIRRSKVLLRWDLAECCANLFVVSMWARLLS